MRKSCAEGPSTRLDVPRNLFLLKPFNGIVASTEGIVANRDIVAIGTSAGGFEALLFLAKGFPQNFPASILVTIHLPLEFRSSLDEMLTRAGPLPATFAQEGDVKKKGHIYIAPPRAAPDCRWRAAVAWDRPSREQRPSGDRPDAALGCGFAAAAGRSEWSSPGRSETVRRGCGRSTKPGA